MKTELAPIALFCYKRVITLKSTIAALQHNLHAKESDLFVFSDAAKTDEDEVLVKEVREYIKTVEGFRNVYLEEAESNKGLAISIITGVTQVLKKHQKVIVLEDDLITSSNFLSFMNQALDYYQSNLKVFSISGYTIPVKASQDYNYSGYFLPRGSSWGWATWYDRWEGVDWEVKNFQQLKNDKAQIAAFNKGGSDLFQMLERQMDGKMDSWAIRWVYHQFRLKTYTFYPIISKIRNIGFNNLASHTNVYNRYATPLDKVGQTSFNFPVSVEQDRYLLSQFQSFFSIKSRAVGKIKTYLYKLNLLHSDVG